MTRKAIVTNGPVVSCDVCGRTLLRGEQSDVFLHGGARRVVCELCTQRAAHEGWIREGLDGAKARPGSDRGRRSLLTRLRERMAEEPGRASAPAHGEPAATPRAQRSAQAPPRTVQAVPTNADLKMARALDVFNVSRHPRTVAGVTRSLGTPSVSVHPSAHERSVVTIVVAWELSWYRYEVDLGDEAAGPRVTAQGSEPSELEPAEQVANASADDRGELRLAGQHA